MYNNDRELLPSGFVRIKVHVPTLCSMTKSNTCMYDIISHVVPFLQPFQACSWPAC